MREGRSIGRGQSTPRRRSAVKGKALRRNTLRELTTVVTPDTILRWHRERVAKKWDYIDRRKSNSLKTGKPRLGP